MQKQVVFSQRVHDRWGLPPDKKILWTMSDEKWWHGLVSRTFAKMCPELGVQRSSFAVHHRMKSHSESDGACDCWDLFRKFT
jgi:hypothetical protein